MNMSIESAIEASKHCIGLDYKKPYKRHGKLFYKPYRNYYATVLPNDTWYSLKLFGYAFSGPVQIKDNRTMVTFHMTRDGLDWLGRELGITIHDEAGHG